MNVEVEPAGFASFGAVVFGRDQEECRERHYLPAQQERHRVNADDSQRHSRYHQTPEQPQFAAVPVINSFNFYPSIISAT